MGQDHYPDIAGYKEGSTSQDAAEDIEAEGRAGRLRQMVRQWFADGHEGTADECAGALGESILAIRPRVSELHNRGFLIETGARRLSSGGRMAHVWKVSTWRQIGEIAVTDVIEPLRQKIAETDTGSCRFLQEPTDDQRPLPLEPTS